MISSQDRLDAYKKAVRLKYEAEKNGDYSSFLYNPSRAKLRDLCKELFKENNTFEDVKSFRLFFGFEHSVENLYKLKDQKDKFRPIENFFKGESDLTDIEGINIAAILVDFKPRPFLRYLRQQEDQSPAGDNSDKATGLKEANTQVIGFITTDEMKIGEDDVKYFPNQRNAFFFWLEKNKLIAVLMLIGVLLGGFSLSQFVFKPKQCMQWQNDHYEVVDCFDSDKGSLNNIIPLNESLLSFRKIPVYDTTIFFNKQGKPLYWYCKVNGVPEFFTTVGDGSHPETGDQVRQVTKHIVNKYVLKK